MAVYFIKNSQKKRTSYVAHIIYLLYILTLFLHFKVIISLTLYISLINNHIIRKKYLFTKLLLLLI